MRVYYLFFTHLYLLHFIAVYLSMQLLLLYNYPNIYSSTLWTNIFQ